MAHPKTYSEMTSKQLRKEALSFEHSFVADNDPLDKVMLDYVLDILKGRS